MSWKNLGLPVQSLIFGAAVAFAAWLLSPYLPGDQHSNVPRHAAEERIGARNHSGDEPYDLSGRRPGGRSGDHYQGRNLPSEGR
jgi:hypothetical protein